MTVQVVRNDLPAELSHALCEAAIVAVDTETSGLNWRVDHLQLCQLFTQETGPVVVQDVDDSAGQLASLLKDPAVLKVFHFAPFDLRFLEAHLGIQVRTVACTKAASKLIDPHAKDHSLKALVERNLAVTLNKGPVRTSDWSAKSLTKDQLAYAAGDVIHLLNLYQVLMKQLETSGLLETYQQVCSYMPVDAHLEVTDFPNPLRY